MFSFYLVLCLPVVGIRALTHNICTENWANHASCPRQENFIYVCQIVIRRLYSIRMFHPPVTSYSSAP